MPIAPPPLIHGSRTRDGVADLQAQLDSHHRHAIETAAAAHGRREEGTFVTKAAAGGVRAAAPRVAVIILTWNRVSDIVTCLESFADVHYPNLEVVAVDNDSADNTVETVRARFPWATLIVNDDNLGYVGGNNVGIRYALSHGADYVFILNSDTKMTPTCLEELVRVMREDPRIAIAGAKNLYMQNPPSPGQVRCAHWADAGAHAPRFVRDIRGVAEGLRLESRNGCMMSRESLETVGSSTMPSSRGTRTSTGAARAQARLSRRLLRPTAAIHHQGRAAPISQADRLLLRYFWAATPSCSRASTPTSSVGAC